MAKLFNLEPISAHTSQHEVRPHMPKELARLATIIKNLYTLTKKSKDASDRRGMTNCVCYTRYNSGAYLMGTSGRCMVVLGLSGVEVDVLEDPNSVQELCELTGLHWGRGKAINGLEAYLWGSKTWETDAGVMPGNPEPVAYWPRIVPTARLTQNGGAAPFNADIVARTSKVVNTLLKMEGERELASGLGPVLLGDPLNFTTARVWASGRILALVMPCLRRDAEDFTISDIKDFMAPLSGGPVD